MQLRNWNRLGWIEEVLILMVLAIFGFVVIAPILLRMINDVTPAKFVCKGDAYIRIYKEGEVVNEYLAWGTTYFDSSKRILILPAKRPISLSSDHSIEIECKVRGDE